MIEDVAIATPDSAEGRRARPRLRRKLLLLLVSFLAAVVVAECLCRIYLNLKHGVPLMDPGRVLCRKYPEIACADATKLSLDKASFNVLLLGGSVIDARWSSVEHELREQLAFAGVYNIKVCNLAVASHTSRDSLIKYRALSRSHFDLVILYHGINDARANNAPGDVYRDDYSHYAWYETANVLSDYHGNSWFALSSLLHQAWLGVKQRVFSGQYLSFYHPLPPPEWTRYGASPKTPVAFEGNVREIVNLAEARSERIVLMTFATFVPSDYSDDAFSDRRLDYALHISPLKMWGNPDDVVSVVALHNQVIRSVASGRGEGDFVDQAGHIGNGKRYFHDACHLTCDGSRQFVKNILASIPPSEWRSSR
tara:strand:- start:31060 stop:32160 length:1101 start_codon:yes stop_codon:yes gene_type:complete